MGENGKFIPSIKIIYNLLIIRIPVFFWYPDDIKRIINLTILYQNSKKPNKENYNDRNYYTKPR